MRREDGFEELRRDIEDFREETGRRLDLIENGLRQQVSLTYAGVVAEYMARATYDFVRSLGCREGREHELECKEEIMGAQRRYIEGLRRGDLSDSCRALGEVIDLTRHIEGKMADGERDSCASCCGRQLEMLEVNRSLLEELAALRAPPVQPEGLKAIDGIDPARVVGEVAASISHEARLRVMLSTFRGENRFTDFSGATGLSGGHLLYHINRLLEHGFIRQYRNKEYGLTRKGVKTLLFLAQLGGETRNPSP